MSSIDLWFPLAEVLPIAEHAIAAAEHSRPPYDEPTDAPPVPSLIWVKDEGTYFRSNGIPAQLDPHREGHVVVSYALGWRESHIGLEDTAAGGDDFAEYLELTAPDDTGETLINLIREFTTQQGWLILTVEASTYTVAFSTASPPTRGF
ncbi:hypothetical protein [Nocardia sp. NPDC050710]|uniref:hypothetical protein n=1 Tax=Nocardia sp. NPDC050710 TaxID=3157220 RepID=UPI0033F06CFD